MAIGKAAEPRKRRVNISIYHDDAEWLQAKQREISFKIGKYIPMCDLMADMVKAAKEGTGES